MSIRDISREAVAAWWRNHTGTTNVSVAADVVLDTIAAPEHRDALVAWLIEASVIEPGSGGWFDETDDAPEDDDPRTYDYPVRVDVPPPSWRRDP